MRPNNCKSCGGKMQGGGNPFDIDPNLFRPPSINQVLPGEVPAYTEPESAAQPMDRIQEGIAKGIIEAPRADSPDEQMTAQQWYDHRNSSPTQKPMKNPDDLMRRIGIGLRGFRTAAGWVARAIEHGRQNQYDYQQQTALGLMNPMPVEDFQPQGRGVNYYAEQGGTNPYSTYMMKGGKLKVVVQDYNKWSNDAQFDFGSGDNDKGKMQQGGMPRFAMTSGLTDAVRTKYTLEGPQEVPYQKLNELPFEPLPYLMPQNQKSNFSITYPDARGQQMTQYYPTLEEWQKKMENTPYISQQIAGDKSSASASGYAQPNLKKGGYEIDRMIVVRRLIPEWLLNLGRLGTGKYRNLKNYEKGGIHIKPENKGKFTDYCGGKVTGECIEKGLNSPSATIRKRANFARNARKWN